jgi:hypothetical protein
VLTGSKLQLLSTVAYLTKLIDEDQGLITNLPSAEQEQEEVVVEEEEEEEEVMFSEP